MEVLERERRGGDEREELSAGVGWKTNVWDTGFVEEMGARGCYDEEGGEIRDLELAMSMRLILKKENGTIRSHSGGPRLGVMLEQLRAGGQCCRRQG